MLLRILGLWWCLLLWRVKALLVVIWRLALLRIGPWALLPI